MFESPLIRTVLNRNYHRGLLESLLRTVRIKGEHPKISVCLLKVMITVDVELHDLFFVVVLVELYSCMAIMRQFLCDCVFVVLHSCIMLVPVTYYFLWM